MSAPKVHIVVLSDRAARGERPDETAPKLQKAVLERGWELDEPAVSVLPDDEERLVETLRSLVDRQVELILTTGGTGVALRDRTPEATRRVIEQELPGFGEMMRSESLKLTPFAAGSRALAGVAQRSLIINLPGSPKGALECLGFVAEAAAHLLRLIAGRVIDCQQEIRES